MGSDRRRSGFAEPGHRLQVGAKRGHDLGRSSRVRPRKCPRKGHSTFRIGQPQLRKLHAMVQDEKASAQARGADGNGMVGFLEGNPQ
jgi:hypothetical protein